MKAGPRSPQLSQVEWIVTWVERFAFFAAVVEFTATVPFMESAVPKKGRSW